MTAFANWSASLFSPVSEFRHLTDVHETDPNRETISETWKYKYSKGTNTAKETSEKEEKIYSKGHGDWGLEGNHLSEPELAESTILNIQVHDVMIDLIRMISKMIMMMM